MATFTETKPDSIIRMITMPLLGVRDDDCIAQGTAVMIGPALALTAAHVVEDFYRRASGRRLPKEEGDNYAELGFQLTCTQLVPGSSPKKVWGKLLPTLLCCGGK